MKDIRRSAAGLFEDYWLLIEVCWLYSIYNSILLTDLHISWFFGFPRSLFNTRWKCLVFEYWWSECCILVTWLVLDNRLGKRFIYYQLRWEWMGKFEWIRMSWVHGDQIELITIQSILMTRIHQFLYQFVLYSHMQLTLLALKMRNQDQLWSQWST